MSQFDSFSDQQDRVVKEIPVFMSKSLNGQLFLIQYPLIPLTTTTENKKILNVKIKPNNEKIQIVTHIDSHVRYDKQKGECFASNMFNSENDDEDERSKDKYLSEHTMESSSLPAKTKSTRYVVGVLHDGQFYISSLKGIVQMKTTFPYLNKADELISKKAQKEEEEVEEATKVNIKFSQNREGAAKSRHTKTYDFLKRKLEEEPWIDLTYVRKNLKDFEKLYSSYAENETPFYSLNQNLYLNFLFPNINQNNIRENKSKDANSKLGLQCSIEEIKTMPFQEQLKNIMKNGKVLRYSQVHDYLKSKLNIVVDDVSLLRSIQTVAVLVQGCWVVKSEFLYPNNYSSPFHGIQGPHMQRARDLILSQFNERRILDRKSLCKLTHLPDEEVRLILSHLSYSIPKKGREFILPFDTDFVATCREVVTRQSLLWDMKNKGRERGDSVDKDSLDNLDKTNDNLSKNKDNTSKAKDKKSRSVSFSSESDSGTDTEKKRKAPSSKGAKRKV